jgi:CheY-like chemotaxis protein
VSKTILVVEDDQELRETMESYLSGRGYKVVTSSDGWNCLREIVVKKPDLILMDINMPKLNGLNALDLIKVTRLTAHTPIIVMSAKADKDTILRAAKLGADDFMEKPFSYDHLASLVAIQLLTLDQEMLTGILTKLRSPDSSSLLSSLSSGTKYSNFDVYPVLHQEIELCVLLPKNVKPSAVAELSEEEMSKQVIVLAKGTTSWKCIYPTKQESVAIPKAA